MKVIDLIPENANCGWCKPLTNERGDYVIMIEGEITQGVIDGTEYYQPEHWQMLTNYYDSEKSGLWREVGCSSCPFKDVCDCMNEEIEEDENND